jgi:cytochrome c-type biogenesis protein CcmH/NrfG
MPEMSERIAELRRELENNPLSRQFYQLGELLRRDGRAAEAINVLRGGLGHHPRYVAAWVSLGRACLDRTEPKAAAEALHEALELDAQNPVAWRLLGEARLGSGDRFGALDAMQHALQLAPGDEVLRAAVDSLASETWPPEPAPASLAAEAHEAALPVAATAPPDAAPVQPLVVEIAPVVAPPPAAPEPAPFVATPPAAVPPAAASSGPLQLDDPFALSASAADMSADVFSFPVETPSFADEPFFLTPPVAPQPAFLSEFAPVAALVAEPHAAAEETGLFNEAIVAVAVPEVEALAEPAPAAAPVAETFAAAAPAPAPAPVPAAEMVEAAPPIEEVVEPAPPAPAAPPQAAAKARPTLTLARLHLQQQDFPAAIAILERLVVSDPDNQEARDLLDLVHDMMAPLPGELPLASARERKIAALQGWLASLTLGQERVANDLR